jgi:spore coat polysaccharide biosynthesis protein SpsF
MNIVVVIQARMGSTRLPGKVMLPLAGAPLLARMLERVVAARTPFETVVATTTDSADDPIVDLSRRSGVACYRGHPIDLLDRHYQAALIHHADVVVKIPSDCPLIDPEVIDRVLGEFIARREPVDYLSNLHPASWPDGQDVEAMTLGALDTAWREARRPFEREHTTPFLWERPERFRIGSVMMPGGEDLSMAHRWTVDYPEDYQFVATIYEHLHAPGRIFGVDHVLSLVSARPDLAAINAHLAGVNWYRNHIGELRTVDASMTRQIAN